MGEILADSLRCNVRVDQFANTLQATFNSVSVVFWVKMSNNFIGYGFLSVTRARM